VTFLDSFRIYGSTGLQNNVGSSYQTINQVISNGAYNRTLSGVEMQM
tara:strand:+ start:1575 stop:1715 length:141 start_codon:yes stop_codon:yes gene_type:complete